MAVHVKIVNCDGLLNVTWKITMLTEIHQCGVGSRPAL